jgi:hypothetical protein
MLSMLAVIERVKLLLRKAYITHADQVPPLTIKGNLSMHALISFLFLASSGVAE